MKKNNLILKLNTTFSKHGFRYTVFKVYNYLSRNLKIIFNPFTYGMVCSKYIFLARHPHTQTDKSNHPEFSILLSKFISQNRHTNAGDIIRLWSLILNIKQILSEGIAGDFAELGVWRGNTSSVLAYFANKFNRRVMLFDTFEGFNEMDLKGIDSNKSMAFANTSINIVKNLIGQDSNVCEFVKGYFPQSILDSHSDRKYAIVSLDCDLYEPMRAGLNFFYPLMPKGAIFFLHDYADWDGANKAINEFCINNNEYIIIMPDQSGSAFIRKSHD